MKKLAFAITACIFLTSCATYQLKAAMKHLEDSPACCQSLRELEFEKINIPESRSFAIDKDSKVFNFETGKSYFKAFELPGYLSPYEIYIKSDLVGGDAPFIFYPAIMFLDENFNVIQMIEKGAFYSKREGGLEITIEIETGQPRYVVIFTTERLLKTHSITEKFSAIPIPLGVAGGVILTPIPIGWTRERIAHAPVGNLKIATTEIPPLIIAARKGDDDTVSTLLRQHADVNIKDASGMTPLISAAWNSHINTVKTLIDNDADVNAESNKGVTALMLASEKGSVEIVRILHAKGARIDKKDIIGATALMYAAAHGRTDTAIALLAAGADVNAKSKEGYTPLLYAIENNQVGALKLLLDHGADVNIKNNDGLTPLRLAEKKGLDEIVGLLKDAGAKE